MSGLTTGSPVTYLLYDIMSGQFLGDIPFEQVSFSQQLNDAGRWQGVLTIEDPRVQALAWEPATRPGRTALYVEANGVLVWGGIIWTRRYTRSERKLRVGANDFWSYFNSRAQAKDYSYQWVYPVTEDPMVIAQTVMNDALASTGSGFASGNVLSLAVNVHGTTASQDWVSMSYPYTELQTVEMIVTQLQQMGYGVGFDFLSNCAWDSSHIPTQSIDLWYPRAGRLAAESFLTIDTASAADWEWPEDATQTGNQVYETSTSMGSILVIQGYTPALTAGYPLLEQLIMHPDINSTPVVQVVLDQVAQADISLYAYPITAPTVTLPMFGDPAIGDFTIGDDVRFMIPSVAGAGIPHDPRFPDGVNVELRIVAADYTVKDEGLSTMKLTLNVPPSTNGPTPAPLT